MAQSPLRGRGQNSAQASPARRHHLNDDLDEVQERRSRTTRKQARAARYQAAARRALELALAGHPEGLDFEVLELSGNPSGGLLNLDCRWTGEDSAPPSLAVLEAYLREELAHEVPRRHTPMIRLRLR